MDYGSRTQYSDLGSEVRNPDWRSGFEPIQGPINQRSEVSSQPKARSEIMPIQGLNILNIEPIQGLNPRSDWRSGILNIESLDQPKRRSGNVSKGGVLRFPKGAQKGPKGGLVLSQKEV